MKKLLTFVLAMVMCLALAACGGPDKQPAIDAFNKTSASFNEIAAVINEDPGAYPEELITVMTNMANSLNESQALLSSDTEVSEEKLNEMIELYKGIDEWIVDVKTEFGL